MSQQYLTAAGKEALRKNIRGLRARLVSQIQEEAGGAYRLDLPLDKARLPAARAVQRERLEAWLDEQARSDGADGRAQTIKQPAELRQRHLAEAAQQAAHTIVNRLTILRVLEVAGLSKPAVVSGGWKSPGYGEFVEFAPELCTDPDDDTKGYASLLELVFAELSLELPGVFGPVGLTRHFPVSGPSLRGIIDVLNDSALDSAWRDDTTLGWVYQFWNDSEREALDDKITNGGKIEPHEIASKTQMFTERYMVEWLVQNSLGQVWLALCQKQGWVSELGNCWKYWVEQPLPAAQIEIESLRELRLLDPSCGSGHFLVIAFELLTDLYREEARQRGECWSDEQIACWIVEKNLHGIDIDPRAIQIAAAAVWLKARSLAPGVRLTRLNLVAPAFQLGSLSGSDPALLRFERELEKEVGIPPALTRQLVTELTGVAHLGSLLRVDGSIQKALSALGVPGGGPAQKQLFAAPREHPELSRDEAKDRLLAKLGDFLAAHEGGSDLGLRLDGEQFAAGVRFVQIARQDHYHLVVGNPPYLGTQKTSGLKSLDKVYAASKENLYAMFIQRSVELAVPGGLVALVTMRSWMYVSHFEHFRRWALREAPPTLLAELGPSSFDSSANVEVAMGIFARGAGSSTGRLLALDVTAGVGVEEKTAALLRAPRPAQVAYEALGAVRGTPILYRWSDEFLKEYGRSELLGDVAPVRVGMKTSNNTRYLRCPWELRAGSVPGLAAGRATPPRTARWVPYIKGAAGKRWIEPLSSTVFWACWGLSVRVSLDEAYGQPPQCESMYFRAGVAYSTIGRGFIARMHRFASIFDVGGSSVFAGDPREVVCLLNSSLAAAIVDTLNPTINFQVGDIARIPLTADAARPLIVEKVTAAFAAHESHREPSVEYKQTGPSSWRCAQDWAQRAVDRRKGEPLPSYEPELDAPEPAAFVSFAVGVALGRFSENGEGILDLSVPPNPVQSKVRPSADRAAADDADTTPHIEPSPLPEGQEILPAGILFVSSAHNVADSLGHSAAERIAEAWGEHGAAVTGKPTELRDWLRKDFFAYHKSLYENRPIYFPLSSSGKNFVVFVSIHRWADDTIKALLAHHLHPAREKLSGEIHDLNAARATSDAGQKAKADKQYVKSQKLFEELEEFIALVTQCAEKGAPPTDPKCTPREVDATFVMDLDDGVMINSAALWPLLAPQWSDPKKWWKELCAADGRKDYDWAHLAARYFPKRVDGKCQTDPSLAVAHGCFWRYHPAKAYAWELRLQDEIGPDFTIDEGARWGDFAWNDGTQYGPRGASDRYRDVFLREHPQQAAEIRAKEEQRRERNRKKAAKGGAGDAEEPADAAEAESEAFRLTS